MATCNAEKMSHLVEEFPFIRTLAHTKSSRKQRKVIKNATTKQLQILVEISLNIVRGCFPLKVRQKRALNRYAPQIRKLARARTVRGVQKQLAKISSPHFLPTILRPIIIKISKYGRK
jgi:hypothetical protein